MEQEGPVERRRRLNREYQRNYRARQRQSETGRDRIRQQNIRHHANHRRNAASRREQQAQANIQNDMNIFDENSTVEQYCGLMDCRCQFCGSKNFLQEKPTDGKFTSCCRKGKVKINQPTDENGAILEYPEFLQNMISNRDDPSYRHFRENIRSYNSALSFASMGANVVEFQGGGPYVFKVHGQIYHRTSHLRPNSNQNPQYAQLYVIDSTQATEVRANNASNVNCFPRILDRIDRFLRDNNRLCDTYSMLREVEQNAIRIAQSTGASLPIVNLVFRRDRHSDQRRYNAPNANEIAMAFVDNDGEPPFERDIRVYPRNPLNSQQPLIKLNILSPNLDPMTYPLIFPYGEPGWRPNWRCESYIDVEQNQRCNVTKLQYVTYLMAIRDKFNPRISSGKLTQQWLVDSYLQVEANNLNYIRHHQKQLRSELYQGLCDHLGNVDNNNIVQAGVPIILPSSFEGSPRNMKERCADAMAIFSKFGPPDLFITFTANPKWLEITENLIPGEQPSDRPDLVARVFKLKLKSLIKDLTVDNILGKTVAFVYTVEFQKRGLPHAHILITLQSDDKFTTTERIDKVVSAEIPDQTRYPKLFEIVTRCMIHGPCGAEYPHSPCMKDGHCKKSFPKEYQSKTIRSVNGYPLYQRRLGDKTILQGKIVDNSFVVPYNRFLLLKYNAHINVEVCTSLKMVKYIYKYIYKGYDCANLSIGTANTNQDLYDEPMSYINARYVSAPEAAWRLLEGPMHDRSHAVLRLPVHLPHQQTIIFEEGREEEALQAAQLKCTKLEAWFQLNQRSTTARNIKYTEIPYHYVFAKNEWKPRQRGENKIIARMYTVGVKDAERFYLRLLLLHVPGATSFEYLRTVDGTICTTFKEAASRRNLFETDEEWDRCLHETAIYKMPSHMRDTFAYICCYCMPHNSRALWEKYSSDMSLDYKRNHSAEAAENLALHCINDILLQHGLSCSSIGLPIPTGTVYEIDIYNQVEEQRQAGNKIASLNLKQKEAFDKIIHAVENENATDHCFYLDGPGGSGKTYLYSTLLSYIRGTGRIALPFATTGIAATLLAGGRTVHSGFKLPVPLLETSSSSMRVSSPEAQKIKASCLIIIDEITMLTKHGLRCIDKLLRDIMCVQQPFGGKVIVIGGDFRQTLPVVVRGSREDIIESCIKSSMLWNRFTKLSLVHNMRSDGQTAHNDWLLNLGSGNLEATPGVPMNSIRIPDALIENGDLIECIYGHNILNMPIEELAKRAILSPTNKNTLEMNRTIIERLPGNLKTYYSADSIITEDPSDRINYPEEFLHQLSPSGMPPHALGLKDGVIIMLLRNLNPKKGLCNGTRLIVKSMKENFITAEIISECNRGEIVNLPRIDLAPSDVNLPFTLKRRQFPVMPAYAMTINKSQGQSFECVGVQLNEPVFAHGQLYVAVSRCKNADQLKILIKNNALQGKLLNNRNYIFTQNIVYQEII